MKVTDLKKLIEKYGGNTKFIEIKEELKKMSYPCNVGEINA